MERLKAHIREGLFIKNFSGQWRKLPLAVAFWCYHVISILKFSRKTLCLILFCLVFSSQSIMAAPLQVKGMRIWNSSEKTRFVLDIDRPPEYQVFTLDDPKRVVLDLEEAKLVTPLLGDLKDSVINRIRSGRRGSGLRLVLDIKEKIKLSSFNLAPNERYGHRLVLDLKHTRPKKKITSRPMPLFTNNKASLRELVVVIDPGHGGDDPGAIGPRGTREKDIVLAVSKELHKRLDQQLGIRPILTRTGDYYVGLRERREIARDRYQADLFVSIHADAWTKASARGASVYVVSSKGASSTLAQFLADTANKSDRVGGVQISKENKMIKGVLADLALAGNLEHSFRVGNTVLDSMGTIAHLHKKHIEQAGFMVLKSLDVPSILVETGFISNPGEERRLRTTAYQRKLANALSQGIVNYFRQYPPPKTLFAAWYGKPTIEHKIAAGETLSGIATRYGVSLRSIRQLNAIKSDHIRVGQVLRVPNS